MCDDSQIREMPTLEQAEVAVGTFRMLADPTRLRILWALFEGEESVGNLAELVGVAPAVASQHLAKLRLGRLVTTRKEGNRVYYAAADVHVRQLAEEALFHADHVTGDRPDHPRTKPAPAKPIASPTTRRRKA